MKAKLIKRGENDYKLFVNDAPFGQSKQSPYSKLSLKNCEAIENGYDLDDIINENCDKWNTEKANGIEEGFQKALEILGDKKYTLEDLEKARDFQYKNFNASIEDVEQSLQQTEWDVSIEMENLMTFSSMPKEGEERVSEQYRLDQDGCLILKRI